MYIVVCTYSHTHLYVHIYGCNQGVRMSYTFMKTTIVNSVDDNTCINLHIFSDGLQDGCSITNSHKLQ